MAVNITGRPMLGVSSLSAPIRVKNTRKMQASWKVSGWLTNENNNRRATNLQITWTLDIKQRTAKKDPKVVTKNASVRVKTSIINLDSFKIGKKTYTRNDFYPVSKLMLQAVTVMVAPKNAKGVGGKAAAKATRKFKVPAAPAISDPTFNTNTGSVSATITTDPGLTYAERYDTKYEVSVYDSRTGETILTSDDASRSTEFSLSYDVQDYQALGYDDYVKVTFEAKARGYAGDSKTVTRTYYVSYPSQVTIKSATCDSKSNTGKMTALIDTNKVKEHPIDEIQLEYLANVDYATADEIAGDAGWTATDIVDDVDCTAMAMPVADLLPDRGKYTWLRIKSYHAAENVLYRYSNYMMVEDLVTPAATAADDSITIISARAGADGVSAVVHLGWNADGQDDSDGTELSWDEEEDAWKSTKDPSKYEFTWSDGRYPETGAIQYHDSATITIKGLGEGEKYHIKARRYKEGDTTTYSDYSNAATVVTSEKPEMVVASCDGYIPVGEPLQIYWTFSGNGVQTAWQIVKADTGYSYRQVTGATGDPSAQGWYELVSGEYVLSADTEVDDEKVYYERETYGSIIAEGEGSIGSAQISADRLASLAVDGTVSFTVQASTGSGFVASEVKKVTILERPTLEVDISPTLTVQPFEFDATVSTPCDLVVIVSSQGANGQYPEGFLTQTSGDTVFSDVISPVWDTENDALTATITLPTGLDFWDLGGYEISVMAIDRTTRLQTDEIVTEFGVEWASQAKDPTAVLTAVDEVDASGVHHLAVDIALTPPSESAETDVYDIYRMDGGNPHLIGQSFPLTYTARDEYAPFGEDMSLYYRIALRTVDGDVAFSDFEYQLESKLMRFDWSGGVLELPYGIGIEDSYGKDVEIRQHMDGSSDAYWNPNIERKGSLSSSVIKIVQTEEVDLVRALARYDGAVFVRLPDGSAYEADVQVTSLSRENEAVTSIAVDATEIGLTREFILPSPYELEDEEGESE